MPCVLPLMLFHYKWILIVNSSFGAKQLQIQDQNILKYKASRTESIKACILCFDAKEI